MHISTFIRTAILLLAPAVLAGYTPKPPLPSAPHADEKEDGQFKQDIAIVMGHLLGSQAEQSLRHASTADIEKCLDAFETALKNGRTTPTSGQTSEKETVTEAGRNLALLLSSKGFRADDFDLATFRRSFTEALQEKGSRLDPQTSEATLKRMLFKIVERDHEAAETNQVESEAFLKHNAGQPGIVSAPNGMQYKVETAGTGPTYDPDEDGDNPGYTVKYTVSDIRGSILADYSETPVFISNNERSKGIMEALAMMPVGSTWTLYLPSHLGFGMQTIRENGSLHIPGYSVLVVRIELCSIVPSAKRQITLPDGTKQILTLTPLDSDNDDSPYLLRYHMFSH